MESQTQRVCGIEVILNRTEKGFDVLYQGSPIGSVSRVERMDQTMWQASDSRRFRTVMVQAVEELLVQQELIDGLGW